MATGQIEIRFAAQRETLKARIERPELRSALFKGLKAWLGLWAVALLCIPVPVMHLVITPLGLIFGPLIGALVFFKSRRMIALIEASSRCPACGEALSISFKDSTPPLYSMCSHCKAGYQVIVLKNESEAPRTEAPD